MALHTEKQRQLVVRSQDGDDVAFCELINIHQARLFRIAYMIIHDRMDAEDVVQESLMTAWRRIHLLEDPNAFSVWVSQITSRAAIDVVRKRARRATESAEVQSLEVSAQNNTQPQHTTSHVSDPARTAVVNAQLEALAEILQTIEPRNRACWVLYEIDGQNYREIASIVGASETTVRGRIARARSAIIDRMKDWR
ncbi:RNA polymerase sigma factor [Corynebacterium freiburgense]|uniref:RNA polymerase sigma factor n=1 Tax=Corynebacterium freiburgense TaxID=556548 RepID=UPI00041145CE|nr:RNA polymerase sigma factor [Corynebacterium freiburgense]WJZ01975.1 ECF RNA polymerase sigma factor SigE [Corynebacterium freiburgense]